MSNKNNPIFRCTQAELYAVCRIIWQSFVRQLAVFTSKKALYNSAYATTAMAEIYAAQALPESPARKEVASSFRIQLVHAMGNCVTQWKLLISYILTAYDEEFIENKSQSAGSGHLTGAQEENWEDVTNLMTAGFNFITENETDLEANNNMPVTFMAQYESNMENFAAIYALFTSAVEIARQKTQIKKAANNTIYKKTLAMGKDGQLYFADDDALKSEFIFDYVLGIVSSPGSAGLTGVISVGELQVLPVQGVTLSLYEGTNTVVDADYVTASEEDGSYDFGGIASGSYTLKMEKEGFVMKLDIVNIEVGVSSRKDFTMVMV